MELDIKTVNTATSSDGSQYGKFVISPLERGFGITVGNSLRRVLLSSLEGTAVTSARIEGITHEYTAIPGVLEDVVDVLLNFKGLAIKTESKEPQTLRIDIDKQGPVLASGGQLQPQCAARAPARALCPDDGPGESSVFAGKRRLNIEHRILLIHIVCLAVEIVRHKDHGNLTEAHDRFVEIRDHHKRYYFAHGIERHRGGLCVIQFVAEFLHGLEEDIYTLVLPLQTAGNSDQETVVRQRGIEQLFSG